MIDDSDDLVVVLVRAVWIVCEVALGFTALYWLVRFIHWAWQG